MNVLAIGTEITYTRTVPFTYEVTRETGVIEGRNWSYENFGSYIVKGGQVVYPEQVVTK